MEAGPLNTFLKLRRIVVETSPSTGEVTRRWEDVREVRAQRVKFVAKAVTRGSEAFVQADAVFYIRIQHHIEDGWRVIDRSGTEYDVVVEPNREKGLNLLKCTKVND